MIVSVDVNKTSRWYHKWSSQSIYNPCRVIHLASFLIHIVKLFSYTPLSQVSKWSIVTFTWTTYDSLQMTSSLTSLFFFCNNYISVCPASFFHPVTLYISWISVDMNNHWGPGVAQWSKAVNHISWAIFWVIQQLLHSCVLQSVQVAGKVEKSTSNTKKKKNTFLRSGKARKQHVSGWTTFCTTASIVSQEIYITASSKTDFCLDDCWLTMQNVQPRKKSPFVPALRNWHQDLLFTI